MRNPIIHIVKEALLLTAVLCPILLWGQDKSTIRFIENKGQLPEHVNFQLKTNAGDIYLEDGTITYCLYDKSLFTDIHHEKIAITDAVFEGHSYKAHFKNSLPTAIVKEKKSEEYYNYYIGNDQSKWASNVFGYGQVEYTNLYEGIDLKYYEYYGQLKYDLIVEPGSNTSDILIEYQGVDDLKIKKGHLHIPTNLGFVIEQSPYAYQYIDGIESQIKCNYKLNGNLLSFEFPEGYDKSIELVIDPILTFATYTGSTADNWGYTATYDNNENMYIAGVAFSLGYPLSTGAFQTSYNGGTGSGYPGTDASISKFSADGTSLIYSTYFGGSGNENPHSIVCNAAGELYVFGSTSSQDLPTTTGALDNSFNGGSSFTSGVLTYPTGTDAYVTKFNTNGTALLGSTYIGGAGNDVVNSSSLLRKNYGDHFRGEIIVDANDNCWIATTTTSINFPIINGFQSSNGGGQDAILFKLNSNLSNLLWSSYYGGSSDDAAYSIQLNSSNQPVITGGTTSSNLPMSSGLNTSYSGSIDGFIALLNTTGSSILNSTYIGTSSYDQCYFVQVDLNDDVYVFGQTQGAYPITPASVYSNPNSGQFIHKLSSDLTTTIFSTVFGSGNGINISPSAFLVSDCGLIYISGWGGSTNAGYAGGSTAGMPLTSDAFQSNTDGSDFYLGVFNTDLTSFVYGTYFGGGISAEHVDGGTSRFDKNGNVYQAVCAGCGANSDFPTTAGAWSNTNNSGNCNLGAFKFDLGSITPVISVPQPWVCLPSSYQFDNFSSGGNTFEWDFGDGTSSTDFEPSHTYTTVGQYEVTLIVSDSVGCLLSDTTSLTIDVFAIDNAVIQQIDTICPGDSIMLNAAGGASYSWTPTTYLSNPSIANPMAFPPATTTYQTIATDNCGTDTAEVTVYVHQIQSSTLPDTTICEGTTATLNATGGGSYFWHPSVAMSNPFSQTPDVTPLTTTTYYVDITTISGCIITDSILVTVINLPQPITSPDTIICIGDSLEIYALGAPNVAWYPSNLVANPTDSITMTAPVTDTTIYVDLTNTCGTITDSIEITVYSVNTTIQSIDTICPGDSILLNASGATSYSWSPSTYLTDSAVSNPLAFPTVTTTYQTIASNICGVDTAIVTVFVHQLQTFTIPDLTICAGTITTLEAFGGINYSWSPSTAMINPTSQTPNVAPLTSITYYVDITTVEGCVVTDSVTITTVSSVPVPNVSSDTTICAGSVIEMYALGGAEVLWYPLEVVANPTDSITLTFPDTSTTIYVDLTNVCGTVTDSIQITVIPINPTIVDDTIICPGESAFLWAGGGILYNWTPIESLSNSTNSTTTATPGTSTTYYVDITNFGGCTRTLDVTVNVYPTPIVDAGEDIFIEFGDITPLNGFAYGTYFWDDQDSLSCLNCLNPLVQPFETTSYILYTIDDNGCKNSDTVTVFLDGILYVPNTFTPNGDGTNDFFRIKGEEIKTFNLMIFNRWGELIYSTDKLDDSWDGRHHGNLVQTDTYVWKVEYEDYQNKVGSLIGHVNVLR